MLAVDGDGVLAADAEQPLGDDGGVGPAAEPRIRDDGGGLADQRLQAEVLRQARQRRPRDIGRTQQRPDHPADGALARTLRPNDQEQLLVAGVERQQQPHQLLQGADGLPVLRPDRGEERQPCVGCRRCVVMGERQGCAGEELRRVREQPAARQVQQAVRHRHQLAGRRVLPPVEPGRHGDVVGDVGMRDQRVDHLAHLGRGRLERHELALAGDGRDVPALRLGQEGVEPGPQALGRADAVVAALVGPELAAMAVDSPPLRRGVMPRHELGRGRQRVRRIEDQGLGRIRQPVLGKALQRRSRGIVETISHGRSPRPGARGTATRSVRARSGPT